MVMNMRISELKLTSIFTQYGPRDRVIICDVTSAQLIRKKMSSLNFWYLQIGFLKSNIEIWLVRLTPIYDYVN